MCAYTAVVCIECVCVCVLRGYTGTLLREGDFVLPGTNPPPPPPLVALS